jgi:hypothetical protein
MLSAEGASVPRYERTKMKKQIDELVREIRRHLDRPGQADPQMAATLAAHQLDGLGIARSYGTALTNLAKDVTMSADDRAYAGEQLDSLPDF